MNINFNQSIYDIDGTTKVGELKETLITLLYNTRLSQDADQQDKQCDIADAIKEGTAELKVEDVVVIKQCVAAGVSTPFLARQIRKLIEGAEGK